MNNLVSIITPSYNSSKYIEETIKSVQNQKHTNWELLITDDGSKDNSVEIILKLLKKDKRIKIFQIQNSGPAIARNNSIKHAKGKYLAFLDSDDIWFSNFLSVSLKKILFTEGFVFASYKRCHEITLKEVYKDFIVPEKVSYQDILKTNSISCLTAFVDIGRLGKEFMPEVIFRQDMGLWLKYLKKIKFAEGIQEPLAIYRIRNKSHSRNKIRILKPQWFFYRHIEKASVLKSIYYMIIWAFYGMKKYIN
ncbi:glycosyltransferase involved in cell wall biosynthesis [Lutibacter sp. Hel_I_33_5]|uniref:glycosyltransferase family 2 protein n=1 Tax=Lutibacter sp. Hel_I_33_5 TaxID=1566289 RepID=UPI0011A4CE61|nr:glycosyltransferase family 2 protein [Lutibacter sp. Hel_I_33_5]TVZ54874.1 glycosyltransferase involved in cell wall biosynthesis [Lutibacter sp. Hel_I_33_5]